MLLQWPFIVSVSNITYTNDSLLKAWEHYACPVILHELLRLPMLVHTFKIDNVTGNCWLASINLMPKEKCSMNT